MTIILNTNRRDDTLALINSFNVSASHDRNIIVLDNFSNDGSVEAIEEKFPEVEIIRLEHNLGYAGNNNAGIQAALDKGADWVFVLNEDTIVGDDCIEKLIQIGESDHRIGILGPMVYHFDEPQVIQSAGGKFDKDWNAFHLAKNELYCSQYQTPYEVDWISGCGILVRSALIEQIGLLDERFFYYFEETEWCIRAKKAGWKIVLVPGAKLWHKGVQRNYQPGPSVVYYATRNRFLLLAKHEAPVKAWLSAWSYVIRTLVKWSIKPRWKMMHNHRDAMWQGVTDFLKRRWGMRQSI